MLAAARRQVGVPTRATTESTGRDQGVAPRKKEGVMPWHVGYGEMRTVSLSEFPGDDALVSFSPDETATGVSCSDMLACWNAIQAAW